jgi:predicted amidophosphoribosyltransferase
MELKLSCPQCKNKQKRVLSWPLGTVVCEGCKKPLLEHSTEALLNQKRIDQCPVCGAAHLYRRKDFNQRLGILLVVVGVVLAYFTYGLSLLVVTLIDFFLVRRVREVGVCYQCQAEFRKSDLVDSLKPFDLELFDYYRNLRERLP